MLDAHVVQVHRLVVQLAAIGDPVLQAADALGKELETFVGLELRVVLGQREELPQAGAQAALGLAQGIHVGALAGAGDGVAGGDDPLQGGTLVLHVLLAGLDQLRQLVMALLEEHVDVGPGLAHGVLQPYQAVVEHHRVAGEQQQDNPESDSGQTHGRSSGRICWHSSCARHVQARRRSRCALFKNANLSHYVAVF
ncbi:Uncharacterised protein [Acinetobacter baumannii]|nr:Uncharacterised protein [Acinetobacter baumannii]